jgi:diamine N-acetyltransferase
MLFLKAITRQNWFSCTKLSVTEEQKKIFTAPVVYWLAESKFETQFIPLAIYYGDTLVGFTVYVANEDGTGEVEAIMIDQHYQRRGYGRQAMELLIHLFQEQHHCHEIKLSHRRNNEIASKLYDSMGFEIISSDEAITRSLKL